MLEKGKRLGGEEMQREVDHNGELCVCVERVKVS